MSIYENVNVQSSGYRVHVISPCLCAGNKHIVSGGQLASLPELQPHKQVTTINKLIFVALDSGIILKSVLFFTRIKASKHTHFTG